MVMGTQPCEYIKTAELYTFNSKFYDMQITSQLKKRKRLSLLALAGTWGRSLGLTSAAVPVCVHAPQAMGLGISSNVGEPRRQWTHGWVPGR